MFKNWKTTFGAVGGTIIMLLGTMKPEIFDVETSAASNTALAAVLTAVGAVINVVTGIRAKDPDSK